MHRLPTLRSRFGKGRHRVLRILLVDDDPALRTLLRTTFEVADVEVVEAADVAAARRAIERERPSVIVLDVRMPVIDGLAYCRELKAAAATRDIPVVLLTGSDGGTSDEAKKAGADAFLRKPFSPLELLSVAERLAGGLYGVPFRATKKNPTGPDEELLLYARDLRHLLEVERTQRRLLHESYLETVVSLAGALESRDTRTGAHSQRVQRYAVELLSVLDPGALELDPGVQYGFLLHDIGKIAIPDRIMLKPGPLTRAERKRMQTHTVIGEQMLKSVSVLQGEGLRVVRSHHERWDGKGYPDGLAAGESPLGARVFAVADTLDAMTSDRPYRRAQRWASAHAEIVAERGKQFDPDVVDAFLQCEPVLQDVRREVAAA
jgi:cyclic di-GMP phosphodiesterase